MKLLDLDKEQDTVVALKVFGKPYSFTRSQLITLCQMTLVPEDVPSKEKARIIQARIRQLYRDLEFLSELESGSDSEKINFSKFDLEDEKVPLTEPPIKLAAIAAMLRDMKFDEKSGLSDSDQTRLINILNRAKNPVVSGSRVTSKIAWRLKDIQEHKTSSDGLKIAIESFLRRNMDLLTVKE